MINLKARLAEVMEANGLRFYDSECRCGLGTMPSMAQLYEHAKQLYGDLGRLEVPQVGKPIADVYNKLLEQAKVQRPTDRLIGTLEPVDDTMHPCVLRVLTGQLFILLGNA